MSRRRSARSSAALLVLLLVACGPTARQAQVNVMLSGLNAASDGFVAFDKAHQADIVAKAPSETEGIAALGVYRATRARVLAALAVAYQSLATAAILDGPHTLASAVSATLMAKQAWDDLRAVSP